MFLQRVGWPRVEHNVQELTNVTPDVFRLAGGLLTNDRDESWTECILEDQLETDNTACGHHLDTELCKQTVSNISINIFTLALF